MLSYSSSLGSARTVNRSCRGVLTSGFKSDPPLDRPMPTDDPGDTIGVWIPDDSDLVERFDRLACDDGRESRSETIREAMALLIAVEEARPPGVATDARAKRHWVTSALRAELREE